MRTKAFRTTIVALLTAATIAGGMAVGTGTAAACAPTQTYSQQLASSLPQLRPGAVGAHVVGLQLNLRNRGYQLLGTGFYGVNTLAAVRDFQRANGIKDSGIVGAKTWQALVGRISVIGTKGLGKLPSFTVHPGETDRDRVAAVFNVVIRLYPDTASSLEWEYYGPNLVNQVKRFQRSVGIKASGIVGQKTWAAMNKVVSVSGGWGC
ncbi:peptidoglycan-binding protein [Actinokineospora sp. HUAS TT18]|uniref:peptidoglycan-binding domain-containing protein n=1 Tax=Actinokineospora sp. HUAS TT18 TaxID=3447451 RepID=UPI003F51B523